MVYYIKVEDGTGMVKTYLRFTSEATAYSIYALMVEECRSTGEQVKLLDENFIVLAAFQTNNPHTVENINQTIRSKE